MDIPYRIKRSSVPGKRPKVTDLQFGELGLNTNDSDLYVLKGISGVGIGSTVVLLTPWNENLGSTSIFYDKSVGIGTTSPSEKLHVQGNVRITGGIYDSNNFVGTTTSVLLSTGIGISWTPIELAALQGLQGLQGSLGSQGNQGLQGIQGTQGNQGLQGTQGTQGTQGLQGTQGNQGLQGTQGSQGTQGNQGLQAGVTRNSRKSRNSRFTRSPRKSGSTRTSGNTRKSKYSRCSRSTGNSRKSRCSRFK